MYATNCFQRGSQTKYKSARVKMASWPHANYFNVTNCNYLSLHVVNVDMLDLCQQRVADFYFNICWGRGGMGGGMESEILMTRRTIAVCHDVTSINQ